MNTIAEHIAYLIGDSTRTTIPVYQGMQGVGNLLHDLTNLSGSQEQVLNNIVYTGPTLPMADIPHPEGVSTIYHNYNTDNQTEAVLADAWAPGNSLTEWFGNLSVMESGETYHIAFSSPTGGTIITEAYGLGEDVMEDNIYSYWQIPYNILNNWVTESLIEVSKVIPDKYKFHMIGSKEFTAREWAERTVINPLEFDQYYAGTEIAGQSRAMGISLDSLNSDEIVSVVRFDGFTAYECRQIAHHMRDKAKFNSGFLEECSETDPVYYIDNTRTLIVMPEPGETGIYPKDTGEGFCQVDFVKYPPIQVVTDGIEGVPVDVQHAVLLSAAIKCKQFQIHRMAQPDITGVKLDEGYEAIKLDRPNVMDAIEKAQNLIDDIGGSIGDPYGETSNDEITGNSFLDYIRNEDIDMALTALKGCAAELEIARTDLSEQEKRGAQYLSQYSQDISKFTQNISAFMGRYKKNYADLDNLKADYQQSIYAMRGQLPNKKQLGENEKKISQIKQVVDKGN